MITRQNKLHLSAVLLAMTLSLSACGFVKKELGVGRHSPDEFMVVKRAPLTLPPDYTLRPPTHPGDADPTADPTGSAKTALLGKPETSAVKGSSENALLEKMGAISANSDIRRLIDEETTDISLKNRSVANKLIFWDDEQPSAENAPSSVVDPGAEAARIRKNKAEGKPVTDGVVPVIEKKKGTLDKIF